MTSKQWHDVTFFLTIWSVFLFCLALVYRRAGAGVHRLPWRHSDDAASASVVRPVLPDALHAGRGQSVRNARDGCYGDRRRVSCLAQRSSQSDRRRHSLYCSVPAWSAAVLAGQSLDLKTSSDSWLAIHSIKTRSVVCQKYTFIDLVTKAVRCACSLYACNNISTQPFIPSW